jgi:hypothetical protein
VGRDIHECECKVCQAGQDEETQMRHRQINVLISKLKEAQRRWYVGSLSQSENGLSDRELARITGLDPKTIRRGRRELANGVAERLGERQRQPGGGRKGAEKKMSSSSRA